MNRFFQYSSLKAPFFLRCRKYLYPRDYYRKVWVSFLQKTNTIPEISSLKWKIFPGNVEIGHKILFGSMVLKYQKTPFEGFRTLPKKLSGEDVYTLHSFLWLRHLSAVGSTQAAQKACDLVEEWLALYYHKEMNGDPWSLFIMASRIHNIIVSWSFLENKMHPLLKRRLWESLFLQRNDLLYRILSQNPSFQQLYALIVLAFAELIFGKPQSQVQKDIWALLKINIDQQILEDGGHIGRVPSEMETLLRAFIELGNMMGKAKFPPLNSLRQTIDRMAPALRTLRHSDGTLAVFNKGVESTKLSLSATLTAAALSSTPFNTLPYSGFARMEAGETVMLFDRGGLSIPKKNKVKNSSKGKMGFEISHKQERIITGAFLKTNQRFPFLAQAYIHEFNYRKENDLQHMILRKYKKDKLQSTKNLLLERTITLSENGKQIAGKEGGCHDRKKDYFLHFHLHPHCIPLILQEEQITIKTSHNEQWNFSWAISSRRKDDKESGKLLYDKNIHTIILHVKDVSFHKVIEWTIRSLS